MDLGGSSPVWQLLVVSLLLWPPVDLLSGRDQRLLRASLRVTVGFVRAAVTSSHRRRHLFLLFRLLLLLLLPGGAHRSAEQGARAAQVQDLEDVFGKGPGAFLLQTLLQSTPAVDRLRLGRNAGQRTVEGRQRLSALAGAFEAKG